MTELEPRHRDPAARPDAGVSFRSARLGGGVAGHPLPALVALIAMVAALVVAANLAGPVDIPEQVPPAGPDAAADGDPASASAAIAPVLPAAGAVVQVVSGSVGPGLPGQRLYLAAGPVERGTSAVPSFLVQRWGDLARGIDMDTVFAWVPASVVAARTEPVDVVCPAAVDSVLDIASLEPFERLACFGDRTLTFGPTITSRLVMGTRTSERWLTQDAHSDVHTAFPFYDLPGVSPNVPDHVWLQVTGHFDDRSSAACGAVEDVVWCRERFVVTGAQRVPSPFMAAARPSR